MKQDTSIDKTQLDHHHRRRRRRHHHHQQQQQHHHHKFSGNAQLITTDTAAFVI